MPQTWQNRGKAFVALGRPEEALASMRRPVELAPDNAWNRLNLGYAELAAGHLREGFALLEARGGVPGFAPQPRGFAQPLWDGAAFPGRTLLLHTDEGFGDTIQFCRYATLAAGRGGKVVLEVKPALVSLLAGLPGVAQVVAQGDVLPPFDLHCPLLRLPFLFDTTLETVPAAPAYLHADPARMAAWAPRLPAGLRVGLAWSGSPAHATDRERSMALAELVPLGGADVAFIGLQPDVRSADAATLAALPWLVNLGDAFADFADTAAVVAQLDLVIAVDTAVAHLAAALGRPTWLMLPQPPEWRWMLGRDDSPWYPTIRLFRQHSPGDWAGVVARVREALATFGAGVEPPAAAELTEAETEVVALLQEALGHHQAGRAAEAEAGYRRVLDRDPEQPDALHLLGILAQQAGRLEDALALMQRSLAADDANFVVHNNCGRVLAALGRLEAAVASFDRAVALAPEFDDALFNRAEALAHLGQPGEALAAYDRVLALRPEFAGAWSNRGNQLIALGRPADAVASFDRAIAADAGIADAYSNRGNALYELGRLDEAVASYDRALALRPEFPEALSNRGVALVDLLRPAEALESQDRALALRPDYVDAWSNRGAALSALDRLEEAVASYDRALALRPDTAHAWSNKGLALQHLQRIDEAFACYARALALDPDHADARVNLACLELATGRFAEGWRDYEWRWRRKKLTTPRRDFAQPQWRGEALAGSTLLLHAEQGFGDTIQFCRYVAMAAERGGRVILEAPSVLLPLLGDLPGIAGLVAYGDPLPAFDLHCPLLSLPLVFGTTPETIPALHLLHADPARVAAWAPLLPAPGRRRIGLAWSGRAAHLNDRNRSIPLAALLPLGDADASFVGLQKDVRPGDAATLAAAPWLVNLGEAFGDFGDAAAVIAELDLVISADSAMAHLAASLGKPTWVLLPDVPDWRWLMQRADSPWYPTVRLFRQARARDWAGVVAEVREALGVAPGRGDAAAGRGDRTAASGPAKHQAGRFDAAAEEYRRALAVDQNLADAHHLLGVLAYQGGRLEEALGLIDAAIARNPADPGFHSNRGLVLADLRRGAEALASYEQAIALQPAFAEAHSNRGNALRELGRPEDALASYDRALALRQDYAEAWSNRASVLVELGRLEEALTACERALALRPDFAEALSNRASALADLGRADEALAACDRALALRPGFAEALANRASVLWRLGRHAEALDGADAALALDPGDADAWSNRGAALAALDRPQEALASYERALALRPDHAEAWSNHGTALAAQHRLEEARASYGRALALRPDHAEARFNLASLELLTGDYAAGWRDYEFRWRSRRSTSPRRAFSQPQWHGETLAGQTLLLHAEQGFGDTIQFCRYAPLAAARGARVVLEVQPALLPLLAGLPGVAEVLSYGSPLPPFDLHCPLLSLPLAFGTTLETIPAPHEYLHSDPARAARWAARFAGVAGRRIGLVWAGNLSAAVDRQRAMRFATLRPLLDADVMFYALQKDVPDLDRADLAAVPRLDNLGPDSLDFADTAAAIAQLDLVITIDTAVAHLAGAMGKPTWVMLRADPDWRWLLGRDDSPWYPSVRLFRQRTPGDWDEVVARVRAALAEAEPEFGHAPPVAALPPPDLLQAAFAQHQAGRLAEAEAGYRRALAADPTLADAYHLLGVLAYQRGQLTEALGLIEQAIARNPADPGYHSNRGLVLADLRRGDDAVASFDHALALAPGLVEARLGRARTLRGIGRLSDALAAYDAALALRPELAPGWSERGALLTELGRIDAALESFARALTLAPELPETHYNQALALYAAERREDALAAYDRALALDPGNVEAWTNRAVVLNALGRGEQALASADHALALRPDHVEALVNRGSILSGLGRYREALASSDEAARLAPNLPAAWSNRGAVLAAMGRTADAEASYLHALELRPDFAEVHVNLAFLRLQTGRFAEAWPEHEWRLQTGKFRKVAREFAQPAWHGEHLGGRTLLLLAEQGFGDTVQFSRFVAPAVARAAAEGGRVVLEVPPELAPLFLSLPGVARVVTRGEALPPFDVQCSLMSLPAVFSTSLATLPSPAALRPDAERIARWAPRLPRGRRRIGLAWSSSDKLLGDWTRSLPLADLLPLAAVDAAFVGLQTPVREADRSALAAAPWLVNLGDEFADFADTAAVIAQLDLVITIDTAVAHVAATLGKPTWVLLGAVADWRWMLGREDSPWYPAAKLFRQRELGNWAEVIGRVRQELEAGKGAAAARPAMPPAFAPAALDLLQMALAQHQAGRLAEAEAGYRRALAADANLADPLHLLGVLAYQRGQLADALGLIEQAIARNPADPSYHSNRGLVLADLGRSAEAVASYDRALALRPDFAEAHSNRGNALRALGRLDDALAGYGRALALRPDYAEAWSNRGSVQVDLGRLGEALASTEQALALRPDYPEALANRAAILVQLGRAEEAVASADAALALRPDLAQAHDHRGHALLALQRHAAAAASFASALALAPDLVEAQLGRARALRGLGRSAEALADYDAALAARPELASGWSDRGALLTELGRIDEALESFDRALALAPDHAEAHYNQALALYAAKRQEEALAAYDRAIALDPGNVEAWTNRAVVLNDLDRADEALASADRALALRPDHVQALVNRGSILTEMERHGEAIENFDRALELAPEMPEVWFDRGISLVALRRIEEGRACYERALALRPDFAEVHVSLAYLHLMSGNLLEGWREHDWRFRVGSFSIGKRDFTQPVWRGEDLAGRTLLLYAEQGFGDTVQFSRFVAPTVARAAAEGGRVILEAQPALLPLLAGLPGVAEVVGRGDPLPPFDLRCALMSLPLVFSTSLDTLPAPVRYLQADPAKVAAWASLLPPGRRRIGLVWSGNPRHGHDRIRSIPLAALQPLADSGATFVGLQLPVRESDRATLDAATWLVNVGSRSAISATPPR